MIGLMVVMLMIFFKCDELVLVDMEYLFIVGANKSTVSKIKVNSTKYIYIYIYIYI